MHFSANLSGVIFLAPFILVIILDIIRQRRILKRNGLHLSDLYGEDEKWRIVRKEASKAEPLYWFLIILGLILAIITAVINKQ